MREHWSLMQGIRLAWCLEREGEREMQWEGEVGDGGVWTSAVGGQWEPEYYC